MPAVRVVVVEDHALLRAGLALALRDAGMTLCAQAADGPAGLAALREHRPDVAIVDHALPGMTGTALAAAIKAERPEIRVAMLTAAEDAATVRGAIAAGVDAYCVKSGDPATLIDAVRAIAAGGAYFDPLVAGVALRGLTAEPEAPALTPRQRAILGLVAQGRSNAQIAAALRIGYGTVKSALAEILDSLDAADRAQAAVTAVRRGLL